MAGRDGIDVCNGVIPSAPKIQRNTGGLVYCEHSLCERLSQTRDGFQTLTSELDVISPLSSWRVTESIGRRSKIAYTTTLRDW